MKKRILSMWLSICMVLCMMPMVAFADSNSHIFISLKFVSAAAGRFHTVLLDENGKVWTAGDNDDGQLGRDTSANDNSTFHQVTFEDNVKIKAIAAGGNHTVLLDENGRVWTAGDNTYGQLGREISDGDNSIFHQVTVENNVKIKAIAAGGNHTVLLDENGGVWTAGDNGGGQLGRTGDKKIFQRVTVDEEVEIKAVAAGGEHTVLLDENDGVWTAGNWGYGQLGREANYRNNSIFQQVTFEDNVKIKAIAAGGYHTVLLDVNDKVWTAGNNKSGQLGRETSNGENFSFNRITINESVKIEAIAAGDNHTVLLAEDGGVWTAGNNIDGQLGRTGDKEIFQQVTVANSVKIKAIAAGGYHTVLLDVNGGVWTTGDNTYGQLGRDATSDDQPTFTQVPSIPNPISIEEEIKPDDTVTQKLPPETIDETGQNITEGDKTALRLQATASKTSIKLKWNAVPEADGYVIYWNKGGAKNKFKQVKVIEGGKTLTWTHKNLKKNTLNKYYVKAYKVINGKKSFIKTSNRIFLVTKGGKYSNVKKLKASVSKVTLKKGKTKALKIKQTYAEKNKNLVKSMRPLTYTTADKTVATVTSKGVIKAKGKGSCYIYITAHSGVYTRVKVTVK